jgi:hypothetical protein
MMRRWICSTTKGEVKMQVEYYGETEIKLGRISSVYDTRGFCDRLISAINVAMTYHDDIDQWNEERKASTIITNDIQRLLQKS